MSYPALTLARMHTNTANIMGLHLGNGRRSIHCRWVGVGPLRRQKPGRSIWCENPKCLRGQAGEGKSCSCWEREPGSDDELESDGSAI